MPKIATKFTADVTLRVGRQSMTVKIPVDLADGHGDDVVASVLKATKESLLEGDSLKLSIVNAGPLKKAYKAYKKSHP